MSSEHDRGDIDVFLPVDSSRGDFAVMARGLNDMVANHIAAKKQAMACVRQFGAGNFDATMDGAAARQEAFINETIELLRANFQAIIGEIQSADRRLHRRPVERAGRREPLPRRFRAAGDGHQRDAGCDPAADRRGQPRARIGQHRVAARTRRDAVRGRSPGHEGCDQHLIDKSVELRRQCRGRGRSRRSGSQQLSSSSEQVSQGATEQAAAAAEQASASMEQMAPTSNRMPTMLPRPRRSRAVVDRRAGQRRRGRRAVQAMRTIAEKIGIVQGDRPPDPICWA